MSVQSVEVTAMCLTCGAARSAKARPQSGGYAWLYRDTLRCAGCGHTTRHIESYVHPDYGTREDAERAACSKTQRYLRLLEDCGDVDIRWSTMPWCLNGHSEEEVSIEWRLMNPDDPVPGCRCAERCPPGARPAGRLARTTDGDRWVVELDDRQPLDRLSGPLERLWRDLTCGTAQTGLLGLA